MFFCIYFFNDMSNDALLIDNECGSQYSHVFTPVQTFFSPHTKK